MATSELGPVRLRPGLIQRIYASLLEGSVQEAAKRAFTPSGPSIEALETRIEDYRRKFAAQAENA